MEATGTQSCTQLEASWRTPKQNKKATSTDSGENGEGTGDPTGGEEQKRPTGQPPEATSTSHTTNSSKHHKKHDHNSSDPQQRDDATTRRPAVAPAPTQDHNHSDSQQRNDATTRRQAVTPVLTTTRLRPLCTVEYGAVTPDPDVRRTDGRGPWQIGCRNCGTTQVRDRHCKTSPQKYHTTTNKHGTEPVCHHAQNTNMNTIHEGGPKRTDADANNGKGGPGGP